MFLLINIQPDSNNDPLSLFDQYATHLPPVDQHIVRPLDLWFKTGASLDSFAHRVCSPSGKYNGTPQRRRRKQQHRQQHTRTRLAEPSAAVLTASGGLLPRDYDRPFIGQVIRQAGGAVVGAVYAIETKDAPADQPCFQTPFIAE